MTGHEYLDGLLKRQVVSPETVAAMRVTRDSIESDLRKIIGSGPRFYYAGSYGKDTMLAVYHDLDIVVYYPTTTTLSLKEIYWQVHWTLAQSGYVAQKKDVAIRLPYQGGFVVDVVPGRAISGDFLYANLYRSEVDSWLQTSIKTHIDTVKRSGLRGTMRLMKLWNVRHSLGLRSFFIELLVARVLKDTQLKGYDKKLWALFEYIAANIESARIVDPANSNNVISDHIPRLTKRQVAAQARVALQAPRWDQILW